MPPKGINIEWVVFICFRFRNYDRHETPGLRGGQSEQLYSSAVVGPHVLDTAHQPVPLLSKNKLFTHKSACLSQNFSPSILVNCPPPSHFSSSTRLSELRLYQARSQRSPLLKRRKSIDSAALHLRIGQSMAYENLPCLASSLLVSSHSAVPGDDLSCGSRVKVTVDR